MVRCAAHVHSDWSYEGCYSLEQISRWFGRLGYSVVLMSEHDRGFTQEKRCDYKAACGRASSRGALLVPGIEYSDPDNVMHVLVWGDLPFLGESRSTEELLRSSHRAGGAAVVAHPTRKSAWRQIKPEWGHWLCGIEVWNRKTDGLQPSRDGVRLARDLNLAAFVGMDFHRAKQLYPLTMRLAVCGPIHPSLIYSAIRSGSSAAQVFGLPIRAWLGKFGAAAAVAERCRRKAMRMRAKGRAAGHA